MTSLRRHRAGDQHRADDQVGAAHRVLDVARVRVERLDRAAEHVLEVAHRLGADVEHGDLRAHADGDGRRVAPDDAAAEDDHATATRAGHAAEQHALAAALLLEARRADLHGHAAGDFAHRAEQRERAVVELDGLVGDAGHLLRASSRVSSGSAARCRYV